jgi:hypothetical protein
MKKIISTISVAVFLFGIPAAAVAQGLSIHATSPEEAARYRPPCSGGDRLLYDRGELWCGSRRFDKAEKASRMKSRDELRGVTLPATRRTSQNITRKFNKHQVSTRAPSRGGYRLRNPASRRRIHTTPSTEVSQNLRTLRRGKRGQGPAVTRQDRSPFARATNHYRRQAWRSSILHSARRVRRGK